MSRGKLIEAFDENDTKRVRMAEKIIKNLETAIKKHKTGAVIMMELPADAYFEANSATIKLLTGKGFEGVYVSFHRPFKSISAMLKQEGVNIDKLIFVDVASALGGEIQEKTPRCVHISPEIDIDELVRAIYTSLDRLKGKKFVFIDSLTTMALYKPLSETMRFSEFLMLTSRKQKEKVLLVFNVAKDLAQKKFIRDIAIHVDEVVNVVK